MRKLTTLIIISVALLLAGMAACSSGGGSDEPNEYILTPDVEDTASVDTTAEEASSNTVPEAAADDTTTADTPTAETVVAVEPEPEPEIPDLYLEVTTPSNESIVKTAAVEVKGNTIPTAIVSVNGVLTSVNAEGEFTADTTLEVGPNFIEIVTSDLEGEEIGEVLTVVYLPT